MNIDAWALGLGPVLCKPFELMGKLIAVVLAWPVLKMTLHSPLLSTSSRRSLNPHNDLKTKKKKNKAENYEESRRRKCDAINCFEAARKAYCFHSECVNREEYEFNLVNFHLQAFNIFWFCYKLEDMNIKMEYLSLGLLLTSTLIQRRFLVPTILPGKLLKSLSRNCILKDFMRTISLVESTLLKQMLWLNNKN